MLVKNKGAAAAFVGLVSLVLIAMVFSYYNPINDYQYHKPTDSPKNESIQDTPAEVIAYYTNVLAWFTGLLAVVSIGQGYALYRSDRTAAHAADSAKKSSVAASKAADVAEQALTVLERPYVFIDRIEFVPPDQHRSFLQLSYIAKNYGKTPAIVRWCEVYPTRISDDHRSEVQAGGTQIFNGQIIIGTGDAKPIPIVGANVLAAVAAGLDRSTITNPLILRMQITYFDVFNYVHVAEFAFFESKGSFTMIADNPNDRHKSKKLNKGELWTPAMSKKLLSEA